MFGASSSTWWCLVPTGGKFQTGSPWDKQLCFFLFSHWLICCHCFQRLFALQDMLLVIELQPAVPNSSRSHTECFQVNSLDRPQFLFELQGLFNKDVAPASCVQHHIENKTATDIFSISHQCAVIELLKKSSLRTCTTPLIYRACDIFHVNTRGNNKKLPFQIGSQAILLGDSI